MRNGIRAIALLLLASYAIFIATAKSGNGATELNLKDLSGKAVHLHDYKGKRVVLNFWATWCVPCKDEMPMLVDAERHWSSKGVFFIAASLDDRRSQKSVAEFIQRFQIDFPVWIGASGDDLHHLGMGEAVPATAFLDENGVIFARVQGEIHRDELEERLEWITGDRSRPAPASLIRHL
jgi:thiol-disulfide isomerase/thioredoxin